MAEIEFAKWMPIQHNLIRGAMSLIPRGLVLHVTDGVRGQLPDLVGIHSTFNKKGTNVSAHFCISKAGEIAQYVSLKDVAFGVGGDKVRDDDRHWISVENIALPGQLLTFAQIASFARLYNYFSSNWGLPLTLANNRDEFGLGYHSMFHRGHPGCPGPGPIGQRAAILKLVEGM
jgi:hypothetical protein